MTRATVSRRQFLRLASTAAAASMVAACGGPPQATGPVDVVDPTTAPEPTTAAATTAPEPTSAPQPTPAAAEGSAGGYQEAPALAELVQQSQLPPVEERVSDEPLVITPYKEVGVYGGNWRSGLLGASDRPWISRTMAYEALLRWDPSLTQVIPNVASAWEVSDDGREYTFFLRPGMRWSDGAPHTADDFVFWYEDVVLNDELMPVKPIWFRTGDDVGRVEKVDDYTFKMVFTKPNGLLANWMATGSTFWPNAAYARQFHIKHNEAEVQRQAADEGYDTWVAYYQQKTDFLATPEVPTLFPWHVTVPVGETTQVVAERNPYYWKVDTAGNQLPYIDQLTYPIVESVDILTLKAISGEVDMMDRHIATPANKAVFSDSMQQGGYGFFNVEFAWEGPTVIALNLNHPDPALRDLFNTKEFRIALSYAINRQEIIDLVYVGDGEPRQPAPLEDSPHFHERLAYQYTEYNPDEANRLLDQIGLTERDEQGYRLRSDGQPLFFAIDVAQAFEPWAEIMELVTSYWKEIGVNAEFSAMERSLFYTRKEAYEHDGGVWTGADAIAVVMDPRWYMPFSNESVYGVAWADWWRSRGARGQEPPPAAKQQQELYDQLQLEADPEKQKEIVRQILDIAAGEFWAMGITRYYQGYGIIKNNFRNVPETLWQWHLSNSPAQTNPEQYFFAPGE